MSDATYELTCLANLEDELMVAARKYPRRRLRRLLAFFGALVIVVPVGYATARELIDAPAPETHTINPKETLEVGYLDPATHQPIVCPDGSLLVKKLEGVKVGGIADPNQFATCPDGSVPEVYKRALIHDLDAWQHVPKGVDPASTQTLKSFEVHDGQYDPG
jgi:hypothetical protein